MTRVICPSDCEFAQNEERTCQLDLVELKQESKGAPGFICNQYVQTDRLVSNKFVKNDMDRAKMAGQYIGIEKEFNKL